MIFRSLKKLIAEEEGSSMVEFAFVLPMLVVLTLGGVYLSVSFSQKSIMNGLAFMETRAAVVRMDHKSIAKIAEEKYHKSARGGQNWLKSTTSEVFDNADNVRTVVVKQQMNIDVLANCLNILGGNKPNGRTEIKKIKSFMILPIEYVPQSKKGKSDRPNTSTTVDYNTTPVGGDFVNANLLDKLPVSLKKMFTIGTVMVDPRKSTTGDSSVHRVNGIISADKNRNMETVNAVYSYWGLDHNYNPNAVQGRFEESPISRGVSDLTSPNTLRFLQLTADNVKAIEAGATIAQVASSFTAIGPALDGFLGPMKKIGGEVLPQVQNMAEDFAVLAENNNNTMFKYQIISR